MKTWLGILFLFWLIIGLTSFKIEVDIHFLVEQTQMKLNSLFNNNDELGKLKEYEILVTDNGFIRYRKIFPTGKQEYYSFNLLRLNSIGYLGNSTEGTLQLKTITADVIIQTYNNPKGNIDSMASQFDLPLKSAEPEDLVQIQGNLFEIKRLLQRKYQAKKL